MDASAGQTLFSNFASSPAKKATASFFLRGAPGSADYIYGRVSSLACIRIVERLPAKGIDARRSRELGT